jgi:peptidoglycan/LPS O-acetylase OafA/YrhL
VLRAGLREIFERPKGRYEAIDGIRAIAVIWVIFFHVLFAWGDSVSPAEYERVVHAPWNWMWTKGFLAINPFFIISGFLIADLLLAQIERRDRVDFRAFYIRRYARLAPAYYLVLVGFILFHRIEPAHYSLDHVWANFLYVNNWFSLRDQPAVWSWSLAVEEQFYLVCPLFILGLWRVKWSAAWVICALIAASIAWNYAIARTAGPFRLVYQWRHDPEAFFTFFDRSYAQTLTRVSALWMGVGCAYLARSAKWMARFRSRAGGGLLAAAFTLISLVTLNPWVNPPSGRLTPPRMTALLNPLSAFSFACLVLLVLSRSRVGTGVGRFLASRLWYPFAQVSYGLYLLHGPVTDAYFRLFPPAATIDPVPLTLKGFAVLGVTSVLAIVLFVVVEAPGRRIGHRVASGLRG